MLQKQVKRFQLSRYEVAAFVLIAFAVVVRVVLVAFHWPESGSDEGTMGLEAMHIAYRGEHPIFLYGQNYMGVAEAYLGALLFHLFGVSMFVLRLGMIILFTLFLIAMYLLTRLLYTKSLALVTLALLSLGAANVILPEVSAVGGVIETLVCGSLMLLLASWLALTSQPTRHPQSWRRLAAYAGWGLVAGLGLWSDLLVAPFVLVSGLLLLLFCWREIRSLAPLFLLLGFMIGIFPLILYNIAAPANQNSLVILWHLHNTGDPNGVSNHFPLLKEIVATMLFSLPIATGLYPACSLQEMPLYGPANSHKLQCSLIQGGWSFGYVALLTLAALLAVSLLWKRWQLHRSTSAPWTTEDRQFAVLQVARLALVLCGALIVLLYMLSPISAYKPWSTRYLIPLLAVLPAVIWPLWNGLRAGLATSSSSRRARIITGVRRGILIGIAAIFLLGTISDFLAIPSAEAYHQQLVGLTRGLLSHGITHVYGGYWTCDSLIFQSREKILCGVIDPALQPGLNRYQQYYTVVHADPRSAYVFAVGSDFDTAFVHRVGYVSSSYQQLRFDGYLVYVPKA